MTAAPAPRAPAPGAPRAPLPSAPSPSVPLPGPARPAPRAAQPLFADLARDDVLSFETPRLWLRWPRAADAAAIERLAGSPAVALATARLPHPYPPGAAAALVLAAREANAAGRGLVLAAALKRGARDLAGVVSLEPCAEGLELGYWLGEAHWGRGLATEAARALVDAGFALARVEAIASGHFADNAASARVLANLGFAGMGPWPLAREGAAPREGRRLLLTRAAWLAGRRRGAGP